MAMPFAGDGVLALMPQEVVNSIDPAPSSPPQPAEKPLTDSPDKSPILVFVYFQKAIRSELDRLHHDAVELATAGSGDVSSLADRCISLFDIYQHHCNAEDAVWVSTSPLSLYLLLSVLSVLKILPFVAWLVVRSRVDKMFWVKGIDFMSELSNLSGRGLMFDLHVDSL